VHIHLAAECLEVEGLFCGGHCGQYNSVALFTTETKPLTTEDTEDTEVLRERAKGKSLFERNTLIVLGRSEPKD
jgi:hypothetical protein